MSYISYISLNYHIYDNFAHIYKYHALILLNCPLECDLLKTSIPRQPI